VSGNWVRRTFHQLMPVTDFIYSGRQPTSSSDYTPMPIQNPIDPNETILVYSLSRSKLGLVDEVDRNSDKIKRWNNGFDADINARIRGGTIFAGASWDRQIRVDCDVDDPNRLRFCDQTAFSMPFRRCSKSRARSVAFGHRGRRSFQLPWRLRTDNVSIG
jgi:hypothetical protein